MRRIDSGDDDDYIYRKDARQLNLLASSNHYMAAVNRASHRTKASSRGFTPTQLQRGFTAICCGQGHFLYVTPRTIENWIPIGIAHREISLGFPGYFLCLRISSLSHAMWILPW
uniref:Uncharacterized protein n=1 Tax=Trichogramma kaykai TaxID=54128 RepID=A0ABD2XLN4_9HYME